MATNPQKIQTPTSRALPVVNIHPSPRNPRHDVGDVSELAASMNEHGLMQPITVRPVGEPFESNWEVVAGHRRLAAAMLLEWKEIQAIVRDDLADDEIAFRLSIVENLQRKDLHPMEEAEAIDQLRERKMTYEEIATHLHKSEAWVAQRASLLRLPKEARKAFKEGALELRSALAIARIPSPEFRRKAFDDAMETVRVYSQELGSADTRIDHAALAQILLRKYTLSLVDAPFDTKAEDLTEAGACGPCPKRSGNARNLFGDVEDGDVCTDPECFDAKSVAHWDREVEKMTAQGKEVLTAAATKKIFEGDHVLESSGYVDADDDAGSIQKWTEKWGDLAKEAGLKPVFARGPDGDIRTLYRKQEVVSAVVKKPKKAAGEISPEKAAKQEAAEKRKKEQARVVDKRIYEATLDAAEAAASKRFLRAAVDGSLEHWEGDAVAKALGWKKKELQTETNPQVLQRYTMAFLIGNVGFNELARKRLRIFAETLGVDLKKIEKDVAEQMKAKEAKPAKKKH